MLLAISATLLLETRILRLVICLLCALVYPDSDWPDARLLTTLRVKCWETDAVAVSASNVLYVCSGGLFITNISGNLATVANHMGLKDRDSLIRLRYTKNLTCSASSEDVQPQEEILFKRFEVFTAVTMRDKVFWDVTPCGSYRNWRSWVKYGRHHHGDKNRRARNKVSRK
jgi:hypothetical protein